MDDSADNILGETNKVLFFKRAQLLGNEPEEFAENVWSVSSRLANSSLLTNATVEFVNDFTAPEYAGNAARLSLTSNSPPPLLRYVS